MYINICVTTGYNTLHARTIKCKNPAHVHKPARACLTHKVHSPRNHLTHITSPLPGLPSPPPPHQVPCTSTPSPYTCSLFPSPSCPHAAAQSVPLLPLPVCHTATMWQSQYLYWIGSGDNELPLCAHLCGWVGDVYVEVELDGW